MDPIDAHVKGRALEERVAALFGAHGYGVTRNVVLEGRSGGRHEIDVLAERSDPLATTRVMVECKAWGAPIEKDVVAKVHLVMRDLGLNQAVIVALDGWRSGAEAAARELGIDLWGPGELTARLGSLAVGELRQGGARRLAQGTPATVAEAVAWAVVDRERRGALGRVREDVTHRGLLWHPHVLLTVASSREEGRLRPRSVTRRAWHVFDAVTGTFVRRLDEQPLSHEVDVGDCALPVRHTAAKLGRDLTTALRRHRDVATDAARERHAARLDAFGLEVPAGDVVVEDGSVHYLPVWTAVLHRQGARRVVAVDAATGKALSEVARRLTAEASLVTEALGGAAAA